MGMFVIGYIGEYLIYDGENYKVVSPKKFIKEYKKIKL
jgi:hypothetical protein